MFLTRKTLSFAALCCLGIASAVAQEVPQTILDCTDLKRDAARLACFDREVAQLTHRSAGVAPTPQAAAPRCTNCDTCSTDTTGSSRSQAR